MNRKIHQLHSLLLASLLVFTMEATACESVGALSDLVCTPGKADTRVAQSNIKETICVKGYTSCKEGKITPGGYQCPWEVRPSVSVTNPIKARTMKTYGNTVHQPDNELEVKCSPKPNQMVLRVKSTGKCYDRTKCVKRSDSFKCYELDQHISLELGGDARDERNLWPEAYYPHPGAFEKDSVENYLKPAGVPPRHAP